MISCDVAIVGAGPYGLSAAAHLAAAGRSVRVFGECMEFWEAHMPSGMLLRSPWAGSHFSDPGGRYTLDAYNGANGNTFSAPIPLGCYVDYGRWFQRQAVPEVDARRVEAMDLSHAGFCLRLPDGELIGARRVVVASGIVPFAYCPPQFAALSPDRVSHSSAHCDPCRFAGQRVAVVGGGQSALESAALLREAGAEVQLLVRAPAVRWLHQRRWLHRGVIARLLYAPPDVGPAGLSHLIAAPGCYRRLPRRLQERWAVRSVRPAGAQWLEPRVQGIPVTLGRSVCAAEADGNEVKLTLDDGSTRRAQHVLMATGYRVDIALYPFLSATVLARVGRAGGYPRLNSGFESTVPGLHFLGAPASWSFGPLMRFVAGAAFASRRLVRSMAR